MINTLDISPHSSLKHSKISKLDATLIAATIHFGDFDKTWNLKNGPSFFLNEFQKKKVLKSLRQLDRGLISSIKGQSPKNFQDRLELLNHLAKNLESSDMLKKNGAIFTPPWLAKYVTDNAIRFWKQLNKGKNGPKSTLDSSCGPGVFLAALENNLGKHTEITGIDINEKFLALADIYFFRNKTNVLLKNDDYLLSSSSKQLDLFCQKKESSKFDIIVGNPPYVRSQHLNSTYVKKLKKNFSDVLNGNFDLTVPFLSSTIDDLAEGGVASLVVSNKLLRSKYGRLICEKIKDEARLLQILDFGDGQLFEGSTTYTCIITFSKSSKAKTFLFKKFDSGVDWNLGITNILKKKEERIPTGKLDSFPWQLSTILEDDVLESIAKSNSLRWDDVFEDTIQGVRTGANDIYLVDQNQKLEEEITKPFVSGEHIRAGFLKKSSKRIIWPYKTRTHVESVKLLEESKIRKSYPDTYKWLKKNSEKLRARNIGEGLPWYAYVRNQNILRMHRPKIIGRELMPRAEFAFDKSGKVTICSGYAMLPKMNASRDIELWASILSTEILEFQLRYHCTQLRNGWFRILKHNLQNIKLPILIKSSHKKAVDLAKKVSLGDEKALIKLNEIVGKAFGLSPSQIRKITKYLERYHDKSLSQEYRKKIGLSKDLFPRPYYLSDLSERELARYHPVELPHYYQNHVERFEIGRKVTFNECKNLPIHRWYRYTQGYSPKLVGFLLDEFGAKAGENVFDPFLGSGTTVVESLNRGLNASGCEISPLMCWIANNKIANWNIRSLEQILVQVKQKKINRHLPKTLLFSKFFNNAYSSNVLSQIFGYKEWIKHSLSNRQEINFVNLGLISILEDISQIRKHGSHYRFLNKSANVGLSKLNIETISDDADIRPILINKLEDILSDIKGASFVKGGKGSVYEGDFRSFEGPNKYDYVITSPPYLNRNNYMVQQKGELVVLGLIDTEEELRKIIKKTFRSHVEANLSKTPTSKIEEVNEIIRLVELSNNNNPKIPHMIAGYFDDLLDTFERLNKLVKPGGKVAFVVGCSRWGGVVVPVDHLLAKIAESKGFCLDTILVTRLKGNSPQQMRQYGRIPLRESIVVFER